MDLTGFSRSSGLVLQINEEKITVINGGKYCLTGSNRISILCIVINIKETTARNIQKNVYLSYPFELYYLHKKRQISTKSEGIL